MELTFERRQRIKQRPLRLRHGDPAFVASTSSVSQRHESFLIKKLISDRKLFGRLYIGLQGSYYFSMPQDAGVFVAFNVPADRLVKDVSKPGDIDLLVIPYEGDEIVLSRIVAIECKIIRAAFRTQGKSPNDFGFSQLEGLFRYGFPYAALSHLIVSDESPESAWRNMGMARVIDQDGQVEILPSRPVDWLPVDLMERAFGRLCKGAAHLPEAGLAAVYIADVDAATSRSVWFPDCRKSELNAKTSQVTLTKVATFFDDHPHLFLDNPAFDPVEK